MKENYDDSKFSDSRGSRITGWPDFHAGSLAAEMHRTRQVLAHLLTGQAATVRWADLRELSRITRLPLGEVVERIDRARGRVEMDRARRKMSAEVRAQNISQGSE